MYKVIKMKRFLTLLVLCLLALTPPTRADEPNPDDMFFNVYTLMMKAETLEGRGKAAEARTNYIEGLKILKEIQLDFPEWNPKVVKYRISYFETKAAPPAATAKPAAKPGGMKSAASETPAPATSGGSGEPVVMKIKWMTGKRYVERLTLVADVDVSPPGQAAQKGQLNFTQGLALSALKDRDGGGKELEAELQDTTINATMNGTTMYGYDAAKPPQNGMVPPEVTAVVKKLKGSKLKFLTDAEGKVESVEGIEDLVTRLVTAADPTANPDDISKKLKDMPAEVMGNLKDAFANMSGLPDKPVEIGDTWSPKTEAMKGLPEGMQINNVYTFKGWEQHDNKRCALIQMTGDFSMKPGAATPPGMPNIKSRVSGKIWFDPETSMVVESSTKPDVNLNMNMGQGGAGSGMAMTLHLSVDLKQLAMENIQ